MSASMVLALDQKSWADLEVRFHAKALDALGGEPNAVSLIRYPLEDLGGSAPVFLLRALLVRDYCVSEWRVDELILNARLACPAAFTFHRIPR